MSSNLVIHGATAGLQTLTGLLFDPNRPYTGCRICGAVFQSKYDRDPVGVLRSNGPNKQFRSEEHVNAHAQELRKGWSLTHARNHTLTEHAALANSGRWYTPEAAHNLAAFGTISVMDLALDSEVSAALAESKPIPVNDSED